MEVASIDEVAAKRTKRSRELDQWLDGGVWKLRPGVDYDVDTDVMQRRLYNSGLRRKVSVAARVGADVEGVFLVVQARQKSARGRGAGRRGVGKAGR